MSDLTPQRIAAAVEVLGIVAAECLFDQGHARDLYVYAEAKNLLTQRLLAKECEIALALAVTHPTTTAPTPSEGVVPFRPRPG